MLLLKRLFGGGSGAAKTPEPIEYNGFRIFPDPVQEAQGYRLAARIEKEIDGEIKAHDLVRADVISDPVQAADAAVQKSKQVIDQMGERVFT